MKSYNTALPLCQELYEKLTIHTGNKNYKLSFAPNQVGISDRYFIYEDINQIEVICFKSSLLKLFKEAHDYFYDYKISDCELSGSGSRLHDIYICTVGLLLATPENKTVLNLHQDILKQYLTGEKFDLLYIQREIYVVERLLTSSNNRLNKSSSLWILYKKLFVIADNLQEKLHLDYTTVLIDSAKVHFSNYYCWNASRWFYDIINADAKKQLFIKLKQFCYKNMRDCSSWDTIGNIACKTKNEIYYHSEEYYRYVDNLGIAPSNTKRLEIITQNFPDFLEELLKYIEEYEPIEWPPFLCLLKLFLNENYNTDLSIFEKWETEVQGFLEKNFEAIISDNKLIFNTNDILIIRKMKTLNFKLEVLQRIKNSNKLNVNDFVCTK